MLRLTQVSSSVLQSLTEDNFAQIDGFYKLITPSDENDLPLAEQQKKASEHIVNFLESSSEEVAGSSCILYCQSIISFQSYFLIIYL